MREYIVKFDTDETPSNFPYGTNVRALMKITGDCDEVIRCKDCKYWGEDGYHNGCKYATCIMGENDYCSMAERGKE